TFDVPSSRHPARRIRLLDFVVARIATQLCRPVLAIRLWFMAWRWAHMLPSFRLIAATFLCGFIAVFAGLRLATSLNELHETFPVMAAHAAPVPATPMADTSMRRGVSAVPV